MIARRVLSYLFIFCVYSSAAGVAQLTPTTLKSYVEQASPYTQTTDQIALLALKKNSIDDLFNAYSLEDILNWDNGALFLSSIIKKAYAPTRQRILATYYQPYAEKLLEGILHCSLQTTTPTALHALNDLTTLNKLYVDLTTGTYQGHAQRVAPLFKTIITEEKRLNSLGYITLFHSQRWEYLFGEKLFTDLWALTQNKQRPTDYIFAHVRLHGIDPLENYSFDRFSIVKNGRTYQQDPTREVLLFTNNSLFANYHKRDGGSSLSFFLKNDNRNTTIHLAPKDIFAHYKLSHLYTKHAKEIAALQKQFDAAKTLGTILLIALPKSIVNDYCFSARAGGYKKTDITDTCAFIESLTLDPTKKINNEEFCVVMLDEAMNPDSGILIKPFHCAEQTAYQKFTASYELLLKKLTTEIQTTPTKKK